MEEQLKWMKTIVTFILLNLLENLFLVPGVYLSGSARPAW